MFVRLRNILDFILHIPWYLYSVLQVSKYYDVHKYKCALGAKQDKPVDISENNTWYIHVK